MWDFFIWFALSSVACWTVAAIVAFQPRHQAKAIAFMLAGIAVFALFIGGMWISLERPPLRTVGETRLWNSFFLPMAGLMIFWRWKQKWVLSFSTLLSIVFICINLMHPETNNKTLMPALQSIWFVPHVIVYMLAYALLGIAFVYALYLLITRHSARPAHPTNPVAKQSNLILLCDNLVFTGTAFLTIGMLLGAFWAKEAWGHYWSWDPKESWAAATWLAYVWYIHYRLHHPVELKKVLWILIVAFLILQICWIGVNYLPSAQGSTLHVYGF